MKLLWGIKRLIVNVAAVLVVAVMLHVYFYFRLLYVLIEGQRSLLERYK